jgi:type I restriction-modification system DNA methylase subunit
MDSMFRLWSLCFWVAACKIRGPLDAPKFKDYILPLIFHKRLSDVFESLSK